MMMLPAFVAVACATLGVALGYRVRVLVERHQERMRERALRALGGELPDWESRARELETHAHEEATYKRNFYKARDLRAEADITRERGRRRDREWT